jgi:DNA-binding MarR family transcriptional regulator
MKTKSKTQSVQSRGAETSTCACTALRKASRAVARQYEMAFSKAGVSATQYSILRALQREGPLPLSRLADLLVLERTSLYRTIRPLQKQGLVKTRATTDQRVKEIVLMTAGLRKIKEAYPHWLDAQQAFLKQVGAPHWERMAPELRHLTAIMARSN